MCDESWPLDNFYNVGTGEKTTLAELAQLLVDLTQFDGEIAYAARSQATLVRNRIGCPMKAKEEINFEAKIGLSDGLLQLINWRHCP